MSCRMLLHLPVSFSGCVTMQYCFFLFLLFNISIEELTLEGRLFQTLLVCAAGLFAWSRISLGWMSISESKRGLIPRGVSLLLLFWCSPALLTGNSQAVPPTKCPLEPHWWKPHESQLLLSFFSLLLRSASCRSECAEAFRAETLQLMQLWFTAQTTRSDSWARVGSLDWSSQFCYSYIKNTVIGAWLASTPLYVGKMAF